MSSQRPVLLRRASSFQYQQAQLAFEQSAKRKDDAQVAVHADIATYTWPDGCTYVGECDEHVAHGLGIKYLPNKWFYCGQWNHGKEHGLGFYQWSDGSWFAGEWLQGSVDGVGVWCGRQGSIYAGEWSAGQKDRLGKQTWTDHPQQLKEYVGMWRLGMRSGLGVETTQDGYYAGQFLDNKRHGVGKCISIDEHSCQTSYTGGWHEGLKHGVGTEMSSCGTFTGEFQRNRRHGLGVLEENTTALKASWKNGVLQKKNSLTTPKFGVKLKTVMRLACDVVQDAGQQYGTALTMQERGQSCATAAMNSALKTRLVVNATMSLIRKFGGQASSAPTELASLPNSFHQICQDHFLSVSFMARATATSRILLQAKSIQKKTLCQQVWILFFSIFSVSYVYFMIFFNYVSTGLPKRGPSRVARAVG
eukprot:m.62402 g.62402  ORF g.62402 m.62402 type:complete len:419 (-) comp13388_c1_seq3:1101-2357(-)